MNGPRLLSRVAPLALLPLLQSCNEPAPAQTAAMPAGRFTVVFSPRIERDTFLIDGTTGQTWQLVDTKDGESVWQVMRRVP